MNNITSFALEDFIIREELIERYDITLDTEVTVDKNILIRIKQEHLLPKLNDMFKCRNDDNTLQHNQKIDFGKDGPCIWHNLDGTISIILSPAAQSSYNFALFQLAHETLHTLFVDIAGQYATYFEEGLATLFQIAIEKHLKLSIYLSKALNYQLALSLVDDLIKESGTFTNENNVIKSIQKIVKFHECEVPHIQEIVPTFNKVKAKILCSYFSTMPHENLLRDYHIL